MSVTWTSSRSCRCYLLLLPRPRPRGSIPPPPLSKAVTFHVLSLRRGLPPARRVLETCHFRGCRRARPGSHGGAHGFRGGRERRRELRYSCRLVRGRQMRVAARALGVPVPEQLARCVQVDASHHQVAREGVPEVVPAKLGDADRGQRTLEGVVERVRLSGSPHGQASTVAQWRGSTVS